MKDIKSFLIGFLTCMCLWLLGCQSGSIYADTEHAHSEYSRRSHSHYADDIIDPENLDDHTHWNYSSSWHTH